MPHEEIQVLRINVRHHASDLVLWSHWNKDVRRMMINVSNIASPSTWVMVGRVSQPASKKGRPLLTHVLSKPHSFE